jgi:hypothetical protein
MLVGVLTVMPLLGYMSSGLKAGMVYEKKMNEFYAADSGVEDALWQVSNDKLDDLFGEN